MSLYVQGSVDMPVRVIVLKCMCVSMYKDVFVSMSV